MRKSAQFPEVHSKLVHRLVHYCRFSWIPSRCRINLQLARLMHCPRWMCPQGAQQHGPPGPSESWTMHTKTDENRDYEAVGNTSPVVVAWSPFFAPAVPDRVPRRVDGCAIALPHPVRYATTAGFFCPFPSCGSHTIRLTAWGPARSLLPNLPNGRSQLLPCRRPARCPHRHNGRR